MTWSLLRRYLIKPCDWARRSLFRRQIALSGARRQAAARHSHVEMVEFPVAFGRREAEKILTVQLVGDVGKRGTEILPETNLRVASTGFFGDTREARVR